MDLPADPITLSHLFYLITVGIWIGAFGHGYSAGVTT